MTLSKSNYYGDLFFLENVLSPEVSNESIPIGETF